MIKGKIVYMKIKCYEIIDGELGMLTSCSFDFDVTPVGDFLSPVDKLTVVLHICF